jgi:AcrR family transcriptional regulator
MAGKLAVRTQAERRAATRAQLLSAAERVIAERGFAAASLGEIAESARVSKGALYHHFASKDDLLLTLLDQHFQQWIDVSARIGADPADQAPRRMVEEVPFDRRWNLLFLEFVIRAARDHIFARKFRRRLERLRTTSAAAIDELLAREGLSSSLTADELTVAVAALGNGLAIEALIGTRMDRDRLYAAVLELMFRGLTAASDQRRGSAG